jgi:ATP-binding cassette subfamily F protein uup
VAALEHVSKCFGDKVVVRDFSCRMQRGDKIGIIGPNGAGKTTLLRLILGELAPDRARCAGDEGGGGLFRPVPQPARREATLIDVISPGSDFVEIGNQRKHVISYLGDFLFAPQRARSLVSSLSGGERNRLLLARLFARPANVLVLDEPTNDLDIETLELLEELLQDYSGTLFLVSHDRAFIDNVVTQTIASEGDGGWREYAGGYQDWADYQAGSAREEALATSAASAATAPGRAAKPRRRQKTARRQAVVEGDARTGRTAAAHQRPGERAEGDRRAPGRSGAVPVAAAGGAAAGGAAERNRRSACSKARVAGWGGACCAGRSAPPVRPAGPRTPSRRRRRRLPKR